MTIQELAVHYDLIGQRLRAAGGTGEYNVKHALGADYSYVASLIEQAYGPEAGDSSRHIAWLVGELRRGLNRSAVYAFSEVRGRLLEKMADRIERVEEENWSIMDEYFNYRDYPGGF